MEEAPAPKKAAGSASEEISKGSTDGVYQTFKDEVFKTTEKTDESTDEVPTRVLTRPRALSFEHIEAEEAADEGAQTKQHGSFTTAEADTAARAKSKCQQSQEEHQHEYGM